MEDQIQQIAGLLQQATDSLNQLKEQSSQQPPTPSRQRGQPQQPAGPSQRDLCQPGPSQSGSQTQPGSSSASIMRYRSIFRRPAETRQGHQQSMQRSRSRSTGATTRGNPSPMGFQRQRPVRRRTFSRKVVCLAQRDDDQVPRFETKARLKRCGLGEKVVNFPADGDASEVSDALQEYFPQLKSCGGFELMRPVDRSRSRLMVVSVGACPAEDIKSFCSDRFYVRPIQVNFNLEEDEPSMTECEKCQRCTMNIPLNLLRDHVDECVGDADLHDDEEESEHELPEVAIDVAQPAVSSDPRHTETSGRRNISDDPEIKSKGLVDVKVEYAISKMRANIVAATAPEDCLSSFCNAFMEGRMLDSRPRGQQEAEDAEGDTYQIYVCRTTALRDMVAEVMVEDFKPYLPLCVEFFGEEADDFGGPRKELLRIVLEGLMNRVFVEETDGVRLGENPAHMDTMFKGAGVIVGLCLLQGGPSPAIFTPTLVESIVAGKELDKPTELFSSGLSKTGVLQLIQAFPQCKQLLMATPVKELTFGQFIGMFEKELSDVGSNRRQREEATLSTFVRYLREVAANSRVVKVADILQFTTGLRHPPPLGFIPKPSIIFEPSSSFLPRAQTCPNTLILPIAQLGDNSPPADKIYEMFDYGFKNDYFGVV